MNNAIAKQEENARDIAKMRERLEATLENAEDNKEMKERLDGEQGGRTFAKAKKVATKATDKKKK